MLDYKDIIIKHYALGMSGREIARTLSVSKTGVNSFLNAFKECKTLSYNFSIQRPKRVIRGKKCTVRSLSGEADAPADD